MNKMNVILLFAMFLYFSPCSVYSATISKTLLISHTKENIKKSPIPQFAGLNDTDSSYQPWGEIPEMTTNIISLNSSLLEINSNKEKTKKAKKIVHKKVSLKNRFAHRKTKKNPKEKQNYNKQNETEKNITTSNSNTTKKIANEIKRKNKEEIKEKDNSKYKIIEADEEDEELKGSLVQIKESINPIFKEESYLDQFQDFLKTEIEKINQEKVDYDSFSFDQNFIHNHYKAEKCDLSLCPINIGFCSTIQKNKCICNINTLNLLHSDPQNIKVHKFYRNDLCGYNQKSLVIAMFLELAFPIGLGHLYARRYLFALIKFISFFMIPLMIILIFGLDITESIKKSFKKVKKDLNFNKIQLEEQKFRYIEYVKTFIILIQAGSFFISFMVDALFFGLGIYKDGNGFNLI